MVNRDEPLIPLTAKEMLKAGLEKVFNVARIHRVKGDPWQSRRNLQRFKDHYGASCYVASQIWNELQTTGIDEARIDDCKKLSVDFYLEALNFLYRYSRESERESAFDRSPKTLRKWCWFYLERIQALKASKIVFPTRFKDSDIWIMTVDGVHCHIREPSHPVYSQDRSFYSFKKNAAGLCYELGIDLYESKLIWMNGPFPAGIQNDKGIFTDRGLMDKLLEVNKKALGGKMYNGYPEACSTFNAFDDPIVKQFKSRAQMRHEQFNGMLKEFCSLADQFRHEQDKFEVCFEAVCVICQYRMEHGEPLFDLLAGINSNN